MKKWLRNIERKFGYIDKSKYDYILDQSERTTQISDKLYQEFLGSLKQEDFFFYPNTQQFREKLNTFFGVTDNQLFLSAGSDVGIKTVIEAFTDGGRVISSNPSFPMYKIYSELYNCEYFGIPHEKDYTISMEKILSNITHDTDLVILANPNSPMGECKSFDEIIPLLEQDVPVLIDEAYIEFCDCESVVKYIGDYPNLIVTRTFSKGFGAAGSRVGMVFSNEENIELISKFRHMYEITGVSIKYCEFLLNNYNLVDNYIQSVKRERKELVLMLKDYDVINSNCNWIHFNTEDDNIKTKQIFDKYKVLTKYCSIPYDNRENWCRLTIQPNITKENFIKELL
jgi:histidinol-phosphate aminotransferase